MHKWSSSWWRWWRSWPDTECMYRTRMDDDHDDDDMMMKMMRWWRWQWRRSWPDTECKEHTRSKALLVVEQLLGEWGRCFAERSSSLSSISLLSKLVIIIIITILDRSFVKASSSRLWWFWSASTCLWKLPESHFSCLQPCGPWDRKICLGGGGGGYRLWIPKVP